MLHAALPARWPRRSFGILRANPWSATSHWVPVIEKHKLVGRHSSRDIGPRPRAREAREAPIRELPWDETRPTALSTTTAKIRGDQGAVEKKSRVKDRDAQSHVVTCSRRADSRHSLALVRTPHHPRVSGRHESTLGCHQ